MSKSTASTINEYRLNVNRPAELQIAIHDLRSYLASHIANASRPHIHSYYQIIWFKSGSGKHFVDFKNAQLVNLFYLRPV